MIERGRRKVVRNTQFSLNIIHLPAPLKSIFQKTFIQCVIVQKHTVPIFSKIPRKISVWQPFLSVACSGKISMLLKKKKKNYSNARNAVFGL